jgi:ABC-2 type transport system ATP-binding protein
MNTEEITYSQLLHLKDLLETDLVAFYKHVISLEFLYEENAGIKNHFIVFGSHLTDFLENNINDHSAKEILVKEGLLLLDMLKSQRQLDPASTKEAEDQKQFFLNKKPSFTSVCICKDISCKISNAFSLQNISLDLKLGEITSLLGENGNGKTTLLQVIAGDLLSTGGQLTYPLISSLPENNWGIIKESIGFVRQDFFDWGDTKPIKQSLKYAAALKGITGEKNEEACNYIITRLGLNKYENSTWHQLSAGYRLRVELARQLIWKPKLLILDEPLANLDIKTQLSFLNDLRALTNSVSHSMAVIISSQNVYEVEKISDKIVFIKNGKATSEINTSDIDPNMDYRCYEIDTRSSVFDLYQAFAENELLEIKTNGFYKIIYTSPDIGPEKMIQKISANKIELSYFRDITNSTRLLFEQ